MNPHSSEDSTTIVWLQSHTDIVIVDLRNLALRQIKNFFPSGQQNELAFPQRCCQMKEGAVVVVLYEMLSTQALAYLHPEVREPNHEIVEDLMPKSSRCS